MMAVSVVNKMLATPEPNWREFLTTLTGSIIPQSIRFSNYLERELNPKEGSG